jgi:hypothetical protein
MEQRNLHLGNNEFDTAEGGDNNGRASVFYPPQNARTASCSAVNDVCRNVRMSDEYPFTLRQVDQARTDFAIIEDYLEPIYARLARVPTRMELARTALGIIFCSAGLVILWFEVFWRHCL